MEDKDYFQATMFDFPEVRSCIHTLITMHVYVLDSHYNNITIHTLSEMYLSVDQPRSFLNGPKNEPHC